MKPVMQLEQACYWYPSVPPVCGLRGVSLAAIDGEILVIVGRSGCGKSTLLGVLAGLYKPSSGRLIVRGEQSTGPSPDVAVVFQENGLFPWLNVLSNVEFPLRVRRIPRQERRSRALDALHIVGLENCERLYPDQLSGGMKQRASIARALCQRARILLMDEPFSAIDAFSRTELQELLLSLNQNQSLTIVLVTHDLNEAAILGDRIAVIHGGRIVRLIKPMLTKGPGRRYDPRLGEVLLELSRVIERPVQDQAGPPDGPPQ